MGIMSIGALETIMRRDCYEGAMAVARTLKQSNVRSIAERFAEFVTPNGDTSRWDNRLICLQKAVRDMDREGSVASVLIRAREMAEFAESREEGK